MALTADSGSKPALLEGEKAVKSDSGDMFR